MTITNHLYVCPAVFILLWFEIKNIIACLEHKPLADFGSALYTIIKGAW